MRNLSLFNLLIGYFTTDRVEPTDVDLSYFAAFSEEEKMRRSIVENLSSAVLSASLMIMGGIFNSAVVNAIGVTVLTLTVTLSAATLTVKALTKMHGLIAARDLAR